MRPREGIKGGPAGVPRASRDPPWWEGSARRAGRGCARLCRPPVSPPPPPHRARPPRQALLLLAVRDDLVARQVELLERLPHPARAVHPGTPCSLVVLLAVAQACGRGWPGGRAGRDIPRPGWRCVAEHAWGGGGDGGSARPRQHKRRAQGIIPTRAAREGDREGPHVRAPLLCRPLPGALLGRLAEVRGRQGRDRRQRGARLLDQEAGVGLLSQLLRGGRAIQGGSPQ